MNFRRYKNFLAIVVFISSRIVRSRYRQFIFAIIGICLGVCAYVISASVMYGFEKFFINQVIEIEPHIVIRSKVSVADLEDPSGLDKGREKVIEVLGVTEREKGEILAWQEILMTLSTLDELISIYPRMEQRAIVRRGDIERGVTLIGIDPFLEENNRFLSNFLRREDLAFLQFKPEGILLGIDLARSLGIEEIGQRIVLSFPDGRSYLLTVIGFFETGITSIDLSRAYVNLRTLQSILGRGSIINVLALYLTNPMEVDSLSHKIQSFVKYEVEPWTKSFASFLKVLKTQNYMTMFIVSIILVVSSFGIFGINLIIVYEKRKEIAIMRAMGISTLELMAIFLNVGILVVLIGATVGSLSALVISEYLSTLNIKMGATIKLEGFVLDKSIKYYIEAFFLALIVAILACVYPAYKASRINPVDVFRNL